MLHAIVVLHKLVELVEFLSAHVGVVVDQGAQGVVGQDEAVVGQEAAAGGQGQLVVGEVVFFIRIQENQVKLG